MKITSIVTATALTAAIGLSTIAPAKADGAASTRNIIIGAAALAAGVAIESNVARKNRQSGTVQGYLPNGGTVYQDGHVVLPSGQSYYPGNNGQQVACNGQNCYTTNNGNNGNNGGYYGNNGGYYGNNGGYNVNGGYNGNNGGYYGNGYRANARRNR